MPWWLPRSLISVITQHVTSVLGLSQGQGAFITFKSDIKRSFFLLKFVFLPVIYYIAINDNCSKTAIGFGV